MSKKNFEVSKERGANFQGPIDDDNCKWLWARDFESQVFKRRCSRDGEGAEGEVLVIDDSNPPRTLGNGDRPCRNIQVLSNSTCCNPCVCAKFQ